MKILYFAWLRQKIGLSEEELRPPATVTNVSQLIEFLTSRGAGYAAAFADLKGVRVAVNQQHSAFQASIGPDDEIAFFPPVTGG